MAEIGISVAAKTAEYTVDPIARQVDYMWNYKTNFDNLDKQLKKLQSRRDMVQHKVDEATRNGEEIEHDVVNWLDNVKKMIDESTEIVTDNNQANMRCFKSWCPDLKKRYQHSKKAAVKAKDVSQLEEQGKFDKISYRTVPEETWHPSSKPFEDFESRTSTFTNVVNALSKPDVHMVGVHGMGGIGKTTLAREVGRKAKQNKLFDSVVFVEVSEAPNIRNIQGVIADKLGLKFQQETEPGRADALRERLKKETKILLILDNIWESLDLEKVGIPFNDDHRGCKLLLTARDEHLLSNEMGCENNYPLGILDEKETWNLFMKIAGSCVESHDLQFLAFDVAKECGGLPIAIVTIAKALANKEEYEWRAALQELRYPSFESLEVSVATKAYSCIKLSYNHLETQELKSTFLLCCTMLLTSKSSIEDLMRYAMGLRLFNTINSMEAAWDRVNTLIQRLQKSCLLLDALEDERFSMHDVVRDVGRSIAIKDQHMFIVKDDMALRNLAEKNPLENCTSITLLDIVELPGELDCPHLTFFYMKSKTRIKMDLLPLPASFCSIQKLRTLSLDKCYLGDMAGIKDFENLEILVLISDMQQLPEEISQLSRLKVLDLRKCFDLKVIPPGTISKLTQLEELYLSPCFDASLGELENLSQLTALQIRIPDAKIVPKGLFSQKLQRYKLYIGVDQWECYSRYETSRSLKLKYDDANICVEGGVVQQLKGIEDLHLIGKQGVKNVLHELSRDGFPKLKHFDVSNNPDLVDIVDFSKQSEPLVAFPRLQTLNLRNLNSLKNICRGQLTLNSFCQLRTITVFGCVKLKSIFSSSISRHLSQLQEIDVADCENVEEIFSVGRENRVVVLDKLHSLSLTCLQKLTSFCNEEEVGSTSDQERHMLDNPTPFFDGKVKFPNLKTLKLVEINFEEIWHNQLPLMSCCFQNLTDLTIQKCCNLKYVFSSSTIGSFVQLQFLNIEYCEELKEIVRSDDLENNVQLPSLNKLWINQCHKMKTLISGDKVTFPNLKEIEMRDMDNLEMIWHNQLEDSKKCGIIYFTYYVQCCQQLCKVQVTSCKSLKNIFPASIARNLSRLNLIYVKKCGITEIVEKEGGVKEAVDRTFVFPELTSLSLHNLQQLRCFYPGMHMTKWPMLKKLGLSNCDEIDILGLFNIQEIILEDQLDNLPQEKVFFKLEELVLDGSHTRMIWQGQLPKILFPELKFLEIQKDESIFLPPMILQRSHNLEKLSLQDSSYEWIFSCEEVEKYAQVKSLLVNGLGNLKQIWKQNSKVDAILHNLESLEVFSCDSLVTLILPTASFQNLTILRVDGCNKLINLVSSSTAKSFVQLKEMEITSCDMMTEVVADEGAEMEEEIKFIKLKSLKLNYLSRLSKFCSGNYNFSFPSLEQLRVNGCPYMNVFSLKAATTPMLQEIRINWVTYYCEGDINTAMQEKLFSTVTLSFTTNDLRMILQKFPHHQFSEVVTLKVFHDEKSVVFPLDILQRFSSLEVLILEDSSYEEILSCEEIEKYTEMLAQLKRLDLEGLDNFMQMWKQGFKLDLLFRNLESLRVYRRNSLIALVPTSASFQNLRSMKVSDCNGLGSLVTTTIAKSLVQLERMQISNCNMMTEVVADGEVEEEIIFSKLETLCLTNLSNLTSFCSGNYTLNFPALDELDVTECPKMMFFSLGVLSTPMLQQIQCSSRDYNLEGDLNLTIQRIHEEMNAESSTKDCAGPSTQHLE
ncbi:hypothetical protein ACOSQ4_021686 [Xanthoceras sorbifolium]